MQFILPSRFNVVKDTNQCTTGVNILVPQDGVTKAFKYHLETIATKASTERMITPILAELRVNPYSRNNYSPEYSARMPYDPAGLSHCVYSRITPMTFRSTNFKESIPYSDYLVLVNAILLASHSMRTKTDWHHLVENFYEWCRLRELHIDFKQDLVISRCTTVWKTVRRADIPFLAHSLIVECSNHDNIQSRIALLDNSGIQSFRPKMHKVG